jgi:uncharacterized membrane protein YqjE
VANDPTAHQQATAGPGESGVFDERTTGEVLASLATNAQGVIRTEIELAKLELTTIAREKAIAVGSFTIAGVLGLFLLGFIGVTIAVTLQLVVPAWLAWLIVTLGYALLAGTGAAVGIRLMKRSVTPEATKDELTTTADWAKAQAKAKGEDPS